MGNALTKRRPAKVADIPLPAVVQGLLAASPQAIDDAKLREMTGDARLRSHAEIGKVFGVSGNTVKQSWAANGMPGERGNYSVAAILAWLIARNRSEAGGKVLDPIDARLREIELRTAELTLAAKERADKADNELLIERDAVTSAIYQIIVLTREGMLSIPPTIEPMLPRDCAGEIVAALTHQIRRQLIALAEGLSRAEGDIPGTKQEKSE